MFYLKKKKIGMKNYELWRMNISFYWNNLDNNNNMNVIITNELRDLIVIR